jgi:hypothetical protein
MRLPAPEALFQNLLNQRVFAAAFLRAAAPSIVAFGLTG